MDMLNRESSDSILTLVNNTYNIHYNPFVIDPKTHPSGTLFNIKRKYDTFLTQLCGTCNDGSLGYPFYVYYKKGEYIGHSYYLDDSLLASLN